MPLHSSAPNTQPGNNTHSKQCSLFCLPKMVQSGTTALESVVTKIQCYFMYFCPNLCEKSDNAYQRNCTWMRVKWTTSVRNGWFDNLYTVYIIFSFSRPCHSVSPSVSSNATERTNKHHSGNKLFFTTNSLHFQLVSLLVFIINFPRTGITNLCVYIILKCK